MDFSQDAPITNFDAAQPLCKPSYQPLRRTGTLTGAAAIASAGMLIPSDAAVANPIYEPPVSHVQATTRANRAIAVNSQPTQALLPQVAQPKQTAFSPDSRSHERDRLEPVTLETATAEPPVIVRAEDGGWHLSEQWTNQPQPLTQSAQTPPACAESDCQKLSYMESKLSKARQKAQAIDQEVQVFETLHAQQDMAAYQKVLGNRTAEVAQQKNRLLNESGQTERLIASLKLQLAAVDADVTWPEQVLSQDKVYLAAWQRLQLTEQSLLEEFSQAELDATTLNTIYTDYQQRQQQLALAAQDSLSRYMLAPNAVAPEVIYRVPAAIDTMQALIVITHEQQVQQLRAATLSQLDQRLQTRHQQLTVKLGEYERLQRQQTIAQTVVNQYEQERDRLLRQQQPASQPGEQQPEQLPSEPSEVWALALPLSDSELVNTILGGLVLAGAIATAAAQRQSKKGITATAQLAGTALTPHPNAQQQANSVKTGLLQAQPVPAGKAAVGEAIYSSQDAWSTDLMTRELHKMLTESTPAATFTYEAKTRLIESLHLSLEEDEVALFADYTARWMIQEFEAEPLAESRAQAERGAVLVGQG